VTDTTAPAADADAATGTGHDQHAVRRMVLFTACLALFVSTLDNTVANVALPSIGRDLSASTAALQWVVDGYVVVRGCLLLSAGALGDRYGRRRMFQYGLTAFGAGSLLCSIAPSAELLVAFRVLQALGGCFLVPSSLALITNAYRDKGERARAIGIWSATTAVSTGLGPPVGGLLVDTLGWRSVFWINLPIVAVAVALAARYASESRDSDHRPLDLPGQALVIVLLVSLTSGFIEASGGRWTSPLVVTLFVVAAGSLVAFVLVEARSRNPLLAPQLFRNRPFSGAAAVATSAFVVYAGFLFVNTLYLQEIRGYSPLAAGLLVVPTTIGNVVLSPLSGRMTASRGPRLPVCIAATSMLAGSLILAFGVADAPIPVLLLAYVLIGSGVGLVNTPITTAAVNGLPDDRAGVAGAVTSTFRQVGNSLGVALLGSLTVTGFLGALPHEVGRLPIPADQRAAAVRTAQQAGGSGALAGLRDEGSGIADAVARAFASGLRTAYLVAAAFAALTLVVGLITFRHPDRSSSPAAES
jgi:EmrB/QacA subfamily drug resistance transporter